MRSATLRCGVDWNRRYRCGSPQCARCRRRQAVRERRAVVKRLDAPRCHFLPVTIRLGATEDVGGAALKLRSDMRNRLNLCRQESRRWADAVIWGWFSVIESGYGQEISAHAIVRIGPLLGAADVYDALARTWGLPQIKVGSAVDRDGLPTLARGVIESVFGHGGEFPGIRDFRSLRFRYGRARTSKAHRGPVWYDPMPMLF
jgi:hypothetical protein